MSRAVAVSRTQAAATATTGFVRDFVAISSLFGTLYGVYVFAAAMAA